MKLLDIIKESKNIGDVYHFTSPRGILGILDSNLLKPSGAGFGGEFVSTTRDRNFVNTKRYEDKSITGHIFRITLDGNKISSRYKSKSHDDRYSYKTKQYIDSTLDYGDEMEERFLCGPKGITNIKTYIKEISIPKNKFMPFDFKFLIRNLRQVSTSEIEQIIGMNYKDLNIGTNPIELVNNIKTYFKTRLNVNIELK